MDRPQRQDARWRLWALAASLLVGCQDQAPRSTIVGSVEPQLLPVDSNAQPLGQNARGQIFRANDAGRIAQTAAPALGPSGGAEADLLALPQINTPASDRQSRLAATGMATPD